jgi:hypothetical protein
LCSVHTHSSPFSPQGSRPGAGGGAPIHNEKRGAGSHESRGLPRAAT